MDVSGFGNYERLEFLGDAYLGCVVAAYLYHRFPKEDEGFLTELRAKIVSRNTLNQLASDIGLQHIILYDRHNQQLTQGKLLGNALEALIGAIYLDKGYKKTKYFILNQLILEHLDILEMSKTETNFKKGIYSYAQRNNQKIEFQLIDEENIGKRKMFKIEIYLDANKIAAGTGWSKKEAEQNAAKEALKILEK